jgi:ribonuclease P protein subunit RPR2
MHSAVSGSGQKKETNQKKGRRKQHPLNISIGSKPKQAKGNHRRSRSRGRPGRRTKDMVDIAKERMRILLTLAEREILRNKNPTRARRYVTLARKIGMRYNVRIEKYFSKKICRSCNSYLATDITCRVRCRGGRVTTICKHCSKISRVPLHTKSPKSRSHP